MNRRDCLLTLSALGAATALASGTAPEASAGAEPASRPAARRPRGSVPFGGCVRIGPLRDDRAYARALATYCDIVVPESDLKWDALRPSRAEFRWEAADEIAAFAAANALKLRGHTLAWYGALPAWVNDLRGRREAERELVGHIEAVVGRYRGRIASWDVVNEPIAEDGSLRAFAWSREIGPDYVSVALRAAAAADPKAQLVVNEYDIEWVGERFARRRAAFLALLRQIKERGAPLHAVGLQAHIDAARPLDRDGLQVFLREVRGMGLEVLVTELDVVDAKLPAAPALRDAIVAARVYDYLDAVFAVLRPGAVITWGLSDKYTWVPIYFTRADGAPNRPLPLDAAMNPKPFWSAIEHFCRPQA